jgi:AcrR family transcriptional regulator
MTARDRVLDALQDLVLEGSPSPSLEAVAARAGVSKGGLLHHFRDKRALVHALAARAVDAMDAALAEAAGEGRAAEAWLRLSAAGEPQPDATRALLSLVRVTGTGAPDLPPLVREAVVRWRALLADELGDPVRAEVVRLVGDGLLLQALADGPPPPARVDALVEHLLGGRA